MARRMKPPNAMASGYMIVRQSEFYAYLGVHRSALCFCLMTAEIDQELFEADGGLPFWRYYRSGWRKDAYRLMEEHLVPECSSDDSRLSCLLFDDYNVCRDIVRIVQPHEGEYEILLCDVYDPNAGQFDLGGHPKPASCGHLKTGQSE